MQRTARDCWIMTSTHNDTSSEGLYVIQGFRFQTVAAQPATRALQDCKPAQPTGVCVRPATAANEGDGLRCGAAASAA